MIKTRSDNAALEVAWFSDLCGGDYRRLGQMDSELRSSFEHCRDIVTTAEKNGFDNILLPSSYQVGQNVLSFASAMATQTSHMNLLAAIRMGEYHPPMLARFISSLDHMLKGRLCINIISSDLPGEKLESELRYRRSKEVIQILQQAWTKEEIKFQGEFYKLNLPTAPIKPYQQNGGPLLYFGGISPAAQELCAEFCDVFLMWPETIDQVEKTMQEMSDKADKFGRTLDFGYRVHVIVRETESKAREAARNLVSNLDGDKAKELKHRSQDSKSAGVLRQDAQREKADSEGYIEENLWSGIGQGRSGCGSAIVGDPDQVLAKIKTYQKLGIKSFIFSGYPLIDECDLFAKYVLPEIEQTKLSIELGRTPKETPETPLTFGPRH
ncbi:MAG: alkanesulfonate monooxygenase [Halobacteriovoraceae bacterium]|nr:alkanesulfonate monooxygenase [Halobacteriovoraceae bacterium]|tara:strand:- start:3894 stop:5039 length:1146 start_codon:yes stop_codon:yes gene_type:complete